MRGFWIFLVIAGCSTPRPTDDDDATGDDDDATLDDDDAVDDDDVADDDDAVGPEGDVALTFLLDLDVDADAVEATLTVEFADPAAAAVTCRQRLALTGQAGFGPGLVADCPACTGVLSFDPESVLDLTNPAVDAGDCDPDWIRDSQLNYAGGMLTPRGEGGFGDLLEIGLIDLDRFGDLDLLLDQAGEYDAEALIAIFEGSGAAFSQVGYLRDATGSVANGTGFAAVAETAGPGGDDWLAAWQIYRIPGVNPHEGSTLQGAYLGRMLWTVNDSW